MSYFLTIAIFLFVNAVSPTVSKFSDELAWNVEPDGVTLTSASLISAERLAKKRLICSLKEVTDRCTDRTKIDGVVFQ